AARKAGGQNGRFGLGPVAPRVTRGRLAARRQDRRARAARRGARPEPTMTWQGRLTRWLGPNLLERLLRMEATLRRRRGRAGAVVAAMIAVIAFADAQLWPGISLAVGYSVPIALGCYVFGVRVGVQLSLLAGVLR